MRQFPVVALIGARQVGKTTLARQVTKSMRSVLEDLRLDHLYIVHPGSRSYPLDRRVTALALTHARVELGGSV
jgi:predicted AAA+ superfamily ATPase